MRTMDATKTTTVWDPALRLCHWTLAAAFTTAWLSEHDYELHRVSGYAVLALVVFRIAWGFVGTRHARFANFVAGPRATLSYLRAIARNTAPRHLGHNPAGAAMVVALLATLLVITVSGIALDAAENRAGPLAATRLYYHTDLIATVHEQATHACLVLIALHLAGVALACRQHRENLVRAMITGRKRSDDDRRARQAGVTHRSG